MTTFQAIVLGLVQGVTEFLPVSSSGHLEVLQCLFGIPQVPPLFDIILHIPSLLAVCIFFRKKIIRLFQIFFRWIFSFAKKSDGAAQEVCGVEEVAFAEDGGDTLTGTEERGHKTIVGVIVTTFVTGLIGLFTSRLLEGFPIRVVFAGFLLTAFLLIASGFVSKKIVPQKTRPLLLWQAAVIGLMQGIGTLPGVSRSGATISGALFCGVERAAAGEYSFIVSIPAILAAFVLELGDIEMVSGLGLFQIAAACLVCFASAYASLALLMRIVKKGRLEWFSVYLIPLGLWGLLFF